MNYSAQMKAVMATAQRDLDAQAHAQLRREAEVNRAMDSLTAAKAALKGCRALEEQSLKAIKASERQVALLRDEQKQALALASQSDDAVTVGNTVNRTLSLLEGLEKDESELMAMTAKARELGVEAQLEENIRLCRADLHQTAETLDRLWAQWNTEVRKQAKALLVATKWYRRARIARNNLQVLRNEHLKVKGDIQIAIDRRNQAQKRLDKLLLQE